MLPILSHKYAISSTVSVNYLYDENNMAPKSLTNTKDKTPTFGLPSSNKSAQKVLVSKISSSLNQHALRFLMYANTLYFLIAVD